MPLLAWFTIWYLKGPKFLSNYSVTSSSVVIDYKYVIKNNNKITHPSRTYARGLITSRTATSESTECHESLSATSLHTPMPSPPPIPLMMPTGDPSTTGRWTWGPHRTWPRAWTSTLDCNSRMKSVGSTSHRYITPIPALTALSCSSSLSGAISFI